MGGGRHHITSHLGPTRHEMKTGTTRSKDGRPASTSHKQEDPPEKADSGVTVRFHSFWELVNYYVPSGRARRGTSARSRFIPACQFDPWLNLKKSYHAITSLALPASSQAEQTPDLSAQRTSEGIRTGVQFPICGTAPEDRRAGALTPGLIRAMGVGGERVGDSLDHEVVQPHDK